ncbi:MAG: hypothetical protein IKP72_14955 [Clostridia bacterium]|nr:hypothetical protein [Clostridia bacterium]
MINQFGQFMPDYPGQQYWQDPAYMRYMAQQHQQPVQQAQQAQQQPSSRMVEVVPASSEQAAKEFPVPAGATQMIIGSDDSFIAVKAVSMTGQVTFDIYDKRPPAPPEKPIDLGLFVTRDELEKRLAELKKQEVPEA